MWLNEHEVQMSVELWTSQQEDYPNLAAGARALLRLVEWTNANSDGWSYWVKPSRASARLQTAIWEAGVNYRRYGSLVDLSASELTAVLRPVKAFLTRQSADWRVVLADPEPEPSPTLGEAVDDLCQRINALREELPAPVRHLLPVAKATRMRAELLVLGLDRLPADTDPRRWS